MSAARRRGGRVLFIMHRERRHRPSLNLIHAAEMNVSAGARVREMDLALLCPPSRRRPEPSVLARQACERPREPGALAKEDEADEEGEAM